MISPGFVFPEVKIDTSAECTRAAEVFAEAYLEIFRKKDDLVLAALAVRDERALWDLGELRTRFGVHIFQSDPERVEHFVLDGKPLVDIWPMENSKFDMRNRREYRMTFRYALAPDLQERLECMV